MKISRPFFLAGAVAQWNLGSGTDKCLSRMWPAVVVDVDLPPRLTLSCNTEFHAVFKVISLPRLILRRCSGQVLWDTDRPAREELAVGLIAHAPWSRSIFKPLSAIKTIRERG